MIALPPRSPEVDLYTRRVSNKVFIYIYIYNIALWCKNQIEHSIWDESWLFCNCACSLEYSSLSTLAGLSYHICGKLEVAFKASPSSQHQHCTDETQTAETVLSAVREKKKQINYKFIPTSLFCGCPLIRGFNENKLYHRLYTIYVTLHRISGIKVNARARQNDTLDNRQ